MRGGKIDQTREIYEFGIYWVCGIYMVPSNHSQVLK